MKHRKLIKEKTAVAGVIEALLLVALVAVILSYIQFAYIPVIMEQKEADHMDQISNQFAQLKSVIEVQSMMGALGTGEPITYTPMSSPVTLGSKELPYFISGRSYGQIYLIDQDDAGDHKINIQPAPADFPSGIPLTSIKYEADNYYFVDQTYVLEGGGIILKQSEGEVMRVNPGIAVENKSKLGYIKIKYFIPLFNGIPGKKSYGHWEDCYIHTNYTKHYTHSDPTVSKIQIYSDYPNAWNDSLVNESRGILWEYCDNGYISVTVDDTVTPNEIEIAPEPGYSLNLELTIAEVGVQVGPGYVIPKE